MHTLNDNAAPLQILNPEIVASIPYPSGITKGGWSFGGKIDERLRGLSAWILPVDRPSGAVIRSNDGSANLSRRPLLRSRLHPGRTLFGRRRPQHPLSFAAQKCGSRVRNQLFCPICKVVIERDETVRGYELSKDQYGTGRRRGAGSARFPMTCLVFRPPTPLTKT